MTDSFPFVLCIGNLSYRTTESTLIEKANTFGRSSTTLLTNRDGLSKGMATMSFSKKSDAQRAFAALNSSSLEGREIVVDCDESLKTPPEPDPPQKPIAKPDPETRKPANTRQHVRKDRDESARIRREDPRDRREREYALRRREPEYDRYYPPRPDPWRDEHAMIRRAESHGALYSRYGYRHMY